MPHNATKAKRSRRADPKSGKNRLGSGEARYTVGLVPSLARQVERYAERADTSVSKAIASLVRLGLESQEARKREFFRRLKENLADDDPKQQDRLVDEFRALILGR